MPYKLLGYGWGHGSSQFFKLLSRIALNVFPIMPLDCGNRSTAVLGKPFDVDAIAQPHTDERVTRAVGPPRSDFDAPQYPIPNTAAPCVEVKRILFLI
jgi:hypothetical protein